MDPGFSKENLDLHFKNARKLDVPVNIDKSDIFEIVQKISNDYPCYMCARMRRGFLYNMAREKGCNKLALGHHFDDVIETTMMNILYAGTVKTMLPKLKSANFEGLTLIRPMYLINEKDIQRIMDSNNIKFGTKGVFDRTLQDGVIYARYKRLDIVVKVTDGEKNIDLIRARGKFDDYQLPGNRN